MSDQDYREMHLNEALPRIYDTVQRWRTQGGLNLSKSDQQIINWLAKTGAM